MKRSNSAERQSNSRSRSNPKILNHALYTSRELAGFVKPIPKRSPRNFFQNKKLSLVSVAN